MSSTKTAYPIEMPFREAANSIKFVGPVNRVLDGVKTGRIHSQPRCFAKSYFGH